MSNAYVTYLTLMDSPLKDGLIRDIIRESPDFLMKDLLV